MQAAQMPAHRSRPVRLATGSLQMTGSLACRLCGSLGPGRHRPFGPLLAAVSTRGGSPEHIWHTAEIS